MVGVLGHDILLLCGSISLHFVLILMLILNIMFILKWGYQMTLTLSEKYQFCQNLRDTIRKLFASKDEIPANPTAPNKKRIKVKKGRRGKRFRRKLRNRQKTEREKSKKEKEEPGICTVRKEILEYSQRSEVMGSAQRMRAKLKKIAVTKQIEKDLFNIYHLLTGSINKFISNNDSMDKYHPNNEKRSGEISSIILEKNPESDSSRLDHLLHAVRNNRTKQPPQEESKDVMEGSMFILEKASQDHTPTRLKSNFGTILSNEKVGQHYEDNLSLLLSNRMNKKKDLKKSKRQQDK